MESTVTKKIISFVFVVAFTMFTACSAEKNGEAVELWNGFTEGMTLKQVEERLVELFGELNGDRVISCYDWFDEKFELKMWSKDDIMGYSNGFSSIRSYLSSHRSDFINGGYGDCDIEVSIFCYRIKEEPYFNNSYLDEEHGNISFHFYPDKSNELQLGGVTIFWGIPIEDLKNSTIKKYGKNFREYTDNSYEGSVFLGSMFGIEKEEMEARCKYYNWSLKNIEVFVCSDVIDYDRPIGLVDSSRYDVYSSKIAKEYINHLHDAFNHETKKKETEEEKSQKAKKLVF